MVFLTGDMHGRMDGILRVRRRLRGRLGPADFLVVLGDFGFLFNGRDAEREELDRLARMRTTFLFIDGNHENFDRLDACPEADWHGGRVHVVRPNVLHLMRGHVFTIEGRTYFAMGGAYSMDRPWRTPGRTWWERELPAAEEYAQARRSLDACGRRVDVVLTHTAPRATMALFGMDHPREAELGAFLDEVQETVDYGAWYFGHVHRDGAVWRRQTALFETVAAIPPPPI